MPLANSKYSFMHHMTTSQIDLDLIKSIADKMRKPLLVKEIILDPNNNNPDSFLNHSLWDDLSIAGGYPGILPLYVELDKLFPEEGWNLVAHDYVLHTVKVIETGGVGRLSLFGGIAGVCFYLRQASKNESRYKKVLHKLDDILLEGLSNSHLQPLAKQLNQQLPCYPPLYEEMQGLSGIGLYCLMNKEKLPFKDMIQKIIRLLISLTHPITIKGKTVPGWYVAPEAFFLDEDRIRFPNGNFNLGLSHGITGVLAFLSIAMLQGIEISDQRRAIETVAHWIQMKRKKYKNRFFWDTMISFEEEVSGDFIVEHKSRDAWCYGTPGVARALYLAGKALQNESIQECALETFISIFASTREEWNLPGPTMCHGIAGLLIITQLMARDTNTPFLMEKVTKLRELLLSYYNPSSFFGFRNIQPLRGKGSEYAWVDQGDILEGVSGILLTLLSLHTDNYRWHLPFLIDW